MKVLSVKNFSIYQHYKDRNPPWVKLHAKVLNDYRFSCLQDASKAHLMLFWVLASRHDNRIPYDLAWLTKQLGATDPIDVDELVAHGFIEVSDDASEVLASRKQSADLETEREGETEVEREKETEKRKSPTAARKKTRAALREPAAFDLAWAAYPKRSGSNPKLRAQHAWNARITEGIVPGELIAGVQRYSAYCRNEGKLGTPYVLQAATFFGPERRWAETWDPSANGTPDADRLKQIFDEEDAAEAATQALIAKRRGHHAEPPA